LFTTYTYDTRSPCCTFVHDASFVLPLRDLCVPVTELSACIPLTTSAISWPQKRKSMFFHIYNIYINVLPKHARIRLQRCVQIAMPSVNHFRRFTCTNSQTHKRTVIFIYIDVLTSQLAAIVTKF
jgi:hypothetical protein